MNNLNDWQIRNENPKQWSLDKGVLTLQVQEGNIFGASSGEVDNMFVHPVSSSDYQAEVAIDLNPTLPFEQAGLGIYWDNDNYVKISKEMFMGERSLVFVVEKSGYPEIKERLSFAGQTVSVKVEKSGGTISTYFRESSEALWQKIGTVDAFLNDEKGVMLYTFSGRKNSPNFAKFSEFKLVD
ncbi:DUF1349 domain-containing protein [Vibrio sp. D404a]|uniref:beta-xylosidase family glycoside hydrolase n=1 Tax=unclassified Vibrio TaxID=2614977 RepID=UPI0025545B3A|nr:MULTISPECIES: DUF1349 domain-containing protein [unclassified Vibrio]MDK9736037.1 DUF1349 domain-containing protein [Vibrio sp. D404a]MDK9797797.1 DUF1349 domain-containing protein [Vibrio sp. D449a]